MILGCCGCFAAAIVRDYQDFYRRKQDRKGAKQATNKETRCRCPIVSVATTEGVKPEGLPNLPQACDALITSEGEPLAPTQPSLPLVSANPSLTVGRYDFTNRGETSPREVMRKKPSLIPQRRFFVSADFCALFCNARAKKRPKSRHNLNCHRSVTDT